MKIAIIGGTNIETLPIRYREQAVSTPYGDVVVFKGKLKEGNEVIFLSRHGVLYAHDPGEINYRANIRRRVRLLHAARRILPDQRLHGLHQGPRVLL